MAGEEIYQPRVMPDAPAAMPLARPDDFGAQVGGALSQAGDVVNRAAIQSYTQNRELEADRELARKQAELGQVKDRQEALAQQMRLNPDNGDPSYPGHEGLWRESTEANRGPLLDNIKEGRNRRMLEQHFNDYLSTGYQREADFAEARRAGQFVVDQKAAQAGAANRIRTTLDDPLVAWQQELNHSTDALYTGNPRATTDVLGRAEQENHDVYAAALFDRTTNGVTGVDGKTGEPGNPQRTIAMIDSGKFGDVSPPVLDAARSYAEAALRRQQAEAHQAEAAQRAAYTDAIAAAKIRDEQGLDVGDLKPIEAAAAQFNDKSALEDVRRLGRNRGFRQSSQNATPEQVQARISALEAVPEAKRSDDVKAEITYLKGHQAALAEGFNTNTAQWVIEHGPPGSKPPPLDGPGGLAAREAWARRMAIAYKRPDFPLFGEDERARYRSEAARPDGEVAVMRDLAGFSQSGRMQAARDIDPENAMLQRLAVVPSEYLPLISEGAAARKANPKLIDGDNGAIAQDAFDRIVGPALQNYSVRDRTAAFEVARSLYAQWASKHAISAFRASDFEPLIRHALGAQVGSWGGNQVILPSGWDDARFHRWLNGYKASGNPNSAPYNADGTPMSEADLRRQFTPVLRPDGGYQFHGPGGSIVKRRDRVQPFILYPREAPAPVRPRAAP
jgi:hypothetical protein